MKKQILLPFVLLGAAGLITSLGACQPRNQEEKPEEGYGVAITNKDALQETWYAGTSRALDIELTPAGNVMQEYTTGALKIESSNPDVVSITGANANALAEGQATVTVKYHGWKDTVDLSISRKQTNKEKFGTVHEGTAEDPFDNEDAVKVGEWAKDNGNTEPLYVTGEIASFYHAPGSRTDGAVSWFLKPAEGQTKKFEVYKCYKATGTGAEKNLTDDDVWVGGRATAYGPITYYTDGNQAEFTGSTFVSCTGNKPDPRTTINATFAEALAAGKALEDGADSYNYYVFDAFVTKKSGTNYFLTATSGEAITDEKANTIEIYNAAAALDAKLTKNAKITVKMILKNYHGQVENLLALTADDITVVTEGGSWEVVPEPAVETRTLAQFIAGENTKAKAYNVTAEIKAFKTNATKDKYGNMTLTDGTNDLIIYGATMTATALKWNDADAYVFTNPQDFMTNTTSNALAVGDTITMKMIRCDYIKDGNTTIEGQGIITNIEGGQGGGGGEQTAITTMQGIYESGKAGDAIDIKGVYVGAYGNKTNEWYIANGDYAVYLYQVNIPSGLAIGDSVHVTGKLGVYKGLIQVAKDGASVEKITETITYNALSYTGGAFTKAQLSRPVQLTGTVKAAVAIDGTANKSVTLTVGTTDVTVYVKKSYGLDYTALNTAFGTANNTVTIKGYVAIYDGATTVNYETSTGYQVVSPVVVEDAEPPAMPGTID